MSFLLGLALALGPALSAQTSVAPETAVSAPAGPLLASPVLSPAPSLPGVPAYDASRLPSLAALPSLPSLGPAAPALPVRAAAESPASSFSAGRPVLRALAERLRPVRTAVRSLGRALAAPFRPSAAGPAELLRRAAPLLSGSDAGAPSLELQGRLWDGRAFETSLPPVRLLPSAAGLNASGRDRRPAAAGDAEGQDELDEGEAAPSVFQPAPETLELRFSRESKNQLKRSQIYASVRLLGGSGSRWHWGRFAGNVPIRVLVGGKTFFYSRVTEGGTKAVEDVTKADLAGVYPEATLSRLSTAELRRKLVEDLTRFNQFAQRKGSRPAVVTLKSEVRIVRFLPFRDARQLDENKIEQDYEPKPRTPVQVPPALAALHAQPPKAVFIDLRGLEGPVGADLLEDIGKLQKAGLYFILLTDKPLAGPGSLEEQLTAGLSDRQREDIVRYKLFAVTENGNRLHEYRGAFPHALKLTEFAPYDLDLMAWIVKSQPLARTVRRGPSHFQVELEPGVDAKAFADGLAMRLALYGLPKDRFVIELGEKDGKATVSLRPNDLPRSIPQLLEALREEQGLYVNPSDLLVLSEDPKLIEAFGGAPTLQARGASARGRDLVELGLAAMLGSYRENMKGDKAASASKISQFQRNPDQLGGDFYNIYMLVGHVMHSSFNWALWMYRSTGVLPPLDQLTARALKTWNHEDTQRTKNLLSESGEAMDDYQANMEARLALMYAQIAEILKKYPIMVGTELPNFIVFDRYKKGALDHRDVLRFVFDFVAARPTKNGLEYVILDFKTGETYGLQGMSKDTQVQLYDLVVRHKWPRLSVPYGLGGKAKPASLAGVKFIFPAGSYQPWIGEWNRMNFEKWLFQIMNRIRRHDDKAAK